MTPLFKKLNFKGQSPVLVVDHPESFAAEIQAMAGETTFVTDPEAAEEVPFVLVFARTRDAVNAAAESVVPRLAGDAVCWFCYPKKSSKKYQSDITRDTGWTALGEHGMEPVRQVAIDADWSALRFRRVEHIKQLKRSTGMLLSEEGKARRGDD
ncbi:hypothetical protein GGR26_003071 [Lewinella marina]|uniref:DUF3052 domain-containing protein n=1 Tax=Neolewinella marina TaxID=438751 RepID=A0A2G0CEP1_9BACT|nr:hypothetical protein [Neolewinella marina]NJB87291.1 hypothetical protein [Neolewinella marina]PHK98387.1 hypothetical protein CGL56_11875 [Neolewinella marina]